MTKAINNNLSTNQLLDIYQEILENRLKIGKLVLFSFYSDWKCILKYGVDKSNDELIFENELLDIKEIETLSYSKVKLSKDFEIVIPVYHKNTPLAFVILGDVDGHKLEMSSAIKHLPFIQTITNVMIVAIENKKLYKSSLQKVALQKELELAEGMQKLLFPTKLPNSKHIEFHAIYLPHQQIGGDYYDVIHINENEYLFCLADVSGKGMSAALLMSNLQAALHVLVKYTQNLEEIISDLNQLIFENAKTEKFISLFIATYHIKTNKLSYINAGHHSPLLLNNNEIISLSKGCTLLGISNQLPLIESETILVSSNALLFAYTDGLTDTINKEDISISQTEIEKILLKNIHSSSEFINKAILFYAEDFKSEMPFVDDIAMLTCKFISKPIAG